MVSHDVLLNARAAISPPEIQTQCHTRLLGLECPVLNLIVIMTIYAAWYEVLYTAIAQLYRYTGGNMWAAIISWCLLLCLEAMCTSPGSAYWPS